MIEKDVTNKMIDALPESWFVQKHQDRCTAGIPDLEVVSRGVTIWVEIKCVNHLMHRRTLTLIGAESYQLKRLQHSHLTKRHNAGQKAFVAYGFSEGVALYSVRKVPHQRNTVQLIEESVLYDGWWNAVLANY